VLTDSNCALQQFEVSTVKDQREGEYAMRTCYTFSHIIAELLFQNYYLELYSNLVYAWAGLGQQCTTW